VHLTVTPLQPYIIRSLGAILDHFEDWWAARGQQCRSYMIICNIIFGR
jgi:hypothetical protein